MRSLYATSLLILGAEAMRLNPSTVSPGYVDWFEHPTYNDADYADYYTRDVSNAINAADVEGADYLTKTPNQYWVENWYKDSSMPITPKINYDQVKGLSEEQQKWRQNKWVDPSVTATNEELAILKNQYKNLLSKLQDIEQRNEVGRKLYTTGVPPSATPPQIPADLTKDYNKETTTTNV